MTYSCVLLGGMAMHAGTTAEVKLKAWQPVGEDTARI